ncbi:hypothetical protein KDX09_20785 [Burkholderia cenocepacia]|uniref:hypothetical protein n=1 Tax=Burkholderia cenocepacia TaxID=95486 RepID=UPI001B8F4CA1|nr:hypothetical protein [Burkholderia cenocepacia]MBR8091827.1 hypothetical protein [Burkholderia cenocepacia]
MQVRVKLSSDPLIDFRDFSYAIADAVCPTGEKGLEGIDCVIGKIVTCQVPIPTSPGAPISSPYYHAWQSVLISDDGRTLNELVSLNQPIGNEAAESELLFDESPPLQIGEITLPCQELSDADREAFAKVLVDIKRPLRYPMSDEERAEFMEAYCKLPTRPMWLPALVTEATINRRKSEHDAVLLRHQRALLQEFEEGRFTPVDAYHAPVASLMPGTFIPREQAIAYLERQGCEYGDEEPDAVVPDLMTQCHIEIETIQVSESPKGDPKRRVGVSRHSPVERAAAVKLYWDLREAKEHDFAAQVAKKYGVTPHTVNNWVRREKREVTEQRRRAASPFAHGNKTGSE